MGFQVPFSPKLSGNLWFSGTQDVKIPELSQSLPAVRAEKQPVPEDVTVHTKVEVQGGEFFLLIYRKQWFSMYIYTKLPPAVAGETTPTLTSFYPPSSAGKTLQNEFAPVLALGVRINIVRCRTNNLITGDSRSLPGKLRSLWSSRKNTRHREVPELTTACLISTAGWLIFAKGINDLIFSSGFLTKSIAKCRAYSLDSLDLRETLGRQR